jgi:hypothetical protein
VAIIKAFLQELVRDQRRWHVESSIVALASCANKLIQAQNLSSSSVTGQDDVFQDTQVRGMILKLFETATQRCPDIDWTNIVSVCINIIDSAAISAVSSFKSTMASSLSGPSSSLSSEYALLCHAVAMLGELLGGNASIILQSLSPDQWHRLSLITHVVRLQHDTIRRLFRCWITSQPKMISSWTINVLEQAHIISASGSLSSVRASASAFSGSTFRDFGSESKLICHLYGRYGLLSDDTRALICDKIAYLSSIIRQPEYTSIITTSLECHYGHLAAITQSLVFDIHTRQHLASIMCIVLKLQLSDRSTLFTLMELRDVNTPVDAKVCIARVDDWP